MAPGSRCTGILSDMQPILPIAPKIAHLNSLIWEYLEANYTLSSATTLHSVWNKQVVRTALTPLTEPRTLWRRITRFLSPWRRVAFHTYLHYFAPAIQTITTTRVLHSSQGLQLCCSHLHNAWRCLCLSSADSHIVPLHYCYISDAALMPYMFSFEILSHIAIQSSLGIHCLPLHLLHHYRILQVWNIQSNLYTL